MVAHAKTAQELIEAYIERDPLRPGRDEARLKQYGIAVWAVIGALESVGGDVEDAAAEHDISPDAVRAALAYYERHRELIDNRREANRPPSDG